MSETKPITWSFSSLKAYQTCARQFYSYKVAKQYVQEETEAIRYGKVLHEAFEFYIKEGGTLSFTMIHNWKRNLAVRPRSSAVVERGGVLVSNYVCLEPAGSLQMYPTAYLRGPDAVARFYSLLLASPGSELDVGGRVWLQGQGSRAEILSRAVAILLRSLLRRFAACSISDSICWSPI